MRFHVLWLAFYLLFAFWLIAVLYHLRGGLTTYALVLMSIVLFVKATRKSRQSSRE
jgi:hypothetical protein